MSQCRIYYSVIRRSRKIAKYPTLRLGKYCLSSPDEHDFQSIAGTIAKKNRKHGAILRTESNGLQQGFRHYTVRLASGSWVEFAVETHR